MFGSWKESVNGDEAPLQVNMPLRLSGYACAGTMEYASFENKQIAMRKLLMKMSMSIDGYVSGPNGEMDWIMKTGDAESRAWAVGLLQESGTIIMGRKSFEPLAQFWPTSTDIFAKPMNELPKAVFTRKGYTAPERYEGMPAAAESWAAARVFVGDLATGINELKQEEGKPIYALGGVEFIRSLLAEELLDELNLAIHPVALGGGVPLFDGIAQPLYLKLTDVKIFPGGTVVHVYAR